MFCETSKENNLSPLVPLPKLKAARLEIENEKNADGESIINRQTKSWPNVFMDRDPETWLTRSEVSKHLKKVQYLDDQAIKSRVLAYVQAGYYTEDVEKLQKENRRLNALLLGAEAYIARTESDRDGDTNQNAADAFNRTPRPDDNNKEASSRQKSREGGGGATNLSRDMGPPTSRSSTTTRADGVLDPPAGHHSHYGNYLYIVMNANTQRRYIKKVPDISKKDTTNKETTSFEKSCKLQHRTIETALDDFSPINVELSLYNRAKKPLEAGKTNPHRLICSYPGCKSKSLKLTEIEIEVVEKPADGENAAVTRKEKRFIINTDNFTHMEWCPMRHCMPEGANPVPELKTVELTAEPRMG